MPNANIDNPPGTQGTGSTDGDESGLKDTLEFGVALGSQASTALIGGVKSVNADGSTALNTAGDNSISILSGATASTQLATGNQAIAIGNRVTASNDYSIAMGWLASATGDQGVALGSEASAVTGAVSVGRYAGVAGTAQSVAIGNQALANGGSGGGVSIGTLSDASGTGAIAIGGDYSSQGARALASGSIAIGGDNGTVGAAHINSSGTDSIVIGTGSTATDSLATVIGKGSTVTSTAGIAIGDNVTSTSGVHIGTGAGSGGAGAHGVGIGRNASTGSAAISIGNQSDSLGSSTIAIGAGAQVPGVKNAIAIGAYSDAAQQGCIAIGGEHDGPNTGAQALITGCIAIGGDDGTNACAQATTSSRAMAFGSGAVCSASDAVSFGVGTNSTANTFQVNAMTIVPPASTTTRAGLRLAHGSTPTSPVDGDMWTTTAGLYVRINGSTVGPLS